MAQHKWHKEIKAWADGADIEAQWQWAQKDSPASGWHKVKKPDFDDEAYIYRIKPQPKEPQYLYVYKKRDSDDYVLSDLEPHPLRVVTSRYKPIGKIKLEQDDE